MKGFYVLLVSLALLAGCGDQRRVTKQGCLNRDIHPAVVQAASHWFNTRPQALVISYGKMRVSSDSVSVPIQVADDWRVFVDLKCHDGKFSPGVVHP